MKCRAPDTIPGNVMERNIYLYIEIHILLSILHVVMDSYMHTENGVQ